MRPRSNTKALQPLSPFLAWPRYLARPPFSLRAIVDGLEASQWEPAASVAAGQQAQRRLLLEWAVNHAPHYRDGAGYADALAAIRRRPAALDEAWARVPILTKPQLRALGRRIDATMLPAGHGPRAMVGTSGSTGIPVEIATTALTREIWDGLTMRDHLWHRRDFGKRLGIIRGFKREAGKRGAHHQPDWGTPAARLFATGASSAIHASSPFDEIAAWLTEFDPHYLLTYPSLVALMLDELGERRPPALEEVRLISEPVDPDLERRLAAQWQVRCSETYSASEVGYIALRCAEHGRLHAQGEAVFVEILDGDGNPCGPGQTGRVVLTSLHNLATPLLRYDIGDYAVAGAACPCGRASPTIERVLGRVRNTAWTPDGRRFYPTGMNRIRQLPAVRQAQWVQTALDRVELRVVLDRPLAPHETDEAIAFVRRVLGYPFDVAVIPVERIARGPTEKFEQFVSMLPETRG